MIDGLTLHERIARHHEHAMASCRLDEELGTLHGIGWTQFVVLDLLDSANGEMSAADLARRCGMGRSHLVLQLMPMEKLGLLARESTGDGGHRRVVLRASGRRLLHEARETAGALCASGLAAA
jgi:DNA-binding MarR family transcriptional regulator